jgi:hypothetical protein
MDRRNPITWVIAGALVLLLVIASLDAVRSSGSNTSASATPATEIFPTTPTPSTTASTAAPQPEPVKITGGSARTRDYVNRLRVICAGGNGRFARPLPGELEPAELEDIAVWNDDAALAAAQVLAALRDVPPPRESDRPINELFAAMEREIAALHKVAAAASGGDYARLERLSRKRVKMTHQRGQIGDRLTSGWGLSPAGLLEMCPLALPA